MRLAKIARYIRKTVSVILGFIITDENDDYLVDENDDYITWQ